MTWLASITNWMDMSLSTRWETAEDRGAWRATVHEVTELGMTQRRNRSSSNA